MSHSSAKALLVLLVLCGRHTTYAQVSAVFVSADFSATPRGFGLATAPTSEAFLPH